MKDARKPPSWLLAELGFEDGLINEDCTAVTGKPGPHLVTLLRRNGAVHETHTISLVHLPDWKAIQRRLADEGYTAPASAGPKTFQASSGQQH
jgi:hypothetical protein